MMMMQTTGRAPALWRSCPPGNTARFFSSSRFRRLCPTKKPTAAASMAAATTMPAISFSTKTTATTAMMPMVNQA